jgi:hypothetical protein
MRGRVLTKDGFSEGPGRGSLRLQVHAPAGGVLLGCWRPAARENAMFGGRDIQEQGVGEKRPWVWVFSGGGPGWLWGESLQLGESLAEKLGCWAEVEARLLLVFGCKSWALGPRVGLPAQPATIGSWSSGVRGAKPCGLRIPN